MTERERALLQGKKINPLTANESALAYAVAHGGSAPTYEVVAEIPVGTGVYKDEAKVYLYNTDVESPESFSGELYFNTADYPLTEFGDDDIFAFNAKKVGDAPAPDDPSKPMYIVNIADSPVMVVSDTNALDNTTVKILKKVEQGGGELPEVTSADNGDVLTVVEGAWAKAEPSGGGKMVVHLTGTEVEGKTVYSADKTVEEIIAADAAGQVVECEYDLFRIPLLVCKADAEGKSCVFIVLTPAESTEIDAFVISAAFEDGVDSWTVEEVEYVQVPTFDTTEDLGKVLTVTANGLAWVTPT